MLFHQNPDNSFFFSAMQVPLLAQPSHLNQGKACWKHDTYSRPTTLTGTSVCVSKTALGDHAISGDSAYWTPGWMETSFHQSDDTWTAFPQVSSDERQGAVGQWWPASTVEESRGRASPDQNLVRFLFRVVALFRMAFMEALS